MKGIVVVASVVGRINVRFAFTPLFVPKGAGVELLELTTLFVRKERA